MLSCPLMHLSWQRCAANPSPTHTLLHTWNQKACVTGSAPILAFQLHSFMQAACADGCGQPSLASTSAAAAAAGVPTACSTQAGLSKLEAELETMLDDPTLQSCCRRDIMQQKRSTKLRAQLLAVDRTEVRLQHRNAVALLAGPMQAQQQQQPEQSDDESSLSGSEDDEAGGLSGGATSMSMRMAHGAWSRLHACMQADGDRLRLGAPARMDRQNPCTLFLRCPFL